MHIVCHGTAHHTSNRVQIIDENEAKYSFFIRYVDSLPGFNFHFIYSYRLLDLYLQTSSL